MKPKGRFKYCCILCGKSTRSAQLSGKGICYGCPNNEKRRKNLPEPAILTPLQSEDAVIMENMREQKRPRKPYVSPETFKARHDRMMVGVSYENYEHLNRRYAD